MGIMMALFDTNILVDYLEGFLEAKEELQSCEKPCISIMTWMEVLVGAKDENREKITRDLLSRFTLLFLTTDVAEKAIIIRKEKRIKLPDAIIWATAKCHNLILITRNTKDFPSHESDIKIPYHLQKN